MRCPVSVPSVTGIEGRATPGSLVGQGHSAHHERVRRPLYMTLGCLSVAVGVLGMVVPLLPTTCFLLAGSWLFARSSPRCERWMFENRLFGAYLYQYRRNRIVACGQTGYCGQFDPKKQKLLKVLDTVPPSATATHSARTRS